MLLELTIRNIALIEQLRVEFSQGLNVLTGETGAGKSIVVDSVNLALGGRASREMMRTGAERASVTALFDVSRNAAARALLSELGIGDEDGLISVKRELTAAGRSLCRLGGEVVPLNRFKQFTALLVDVHGQHEHQALLNPQRHVDFIDAYGDERHVRLMDEVRDAVARYRALCQEVDRVSLNAAERERRVDMLSFQIDEISAINPKPGEDEKLERKNRLMENAQKIADAVRNAYKLVYEGGGRSISAQDALKRAHDAMASLSGLDERFDRLAERLEEMYYAVQDVGYELQDLNESLDYDPAQGARVADRLADLKKLKRKYGPELSDVLAFWEKAKFERGEIESSDEKLAALISQRDQQEACVKTLCAQLTQSRTEIAQRFERALLGQLSDLGMGRARFEARFAPRQAAGQFTLNGADQVDFMISPNPGEPLKPLSAIASGGELSRVMLAIKAIEADRGGVDTMIFDEIDTGVSGRMAQVVGEKMAAIARRRQVICVTHLPQIAALAMDHYVVEKTVTGERTGSSVRRLDREGRVRELARLVGGAGGAESGLGYASDMLNAAQALLSRLNEQSARSGL